MTLPACGGLAISYVRSPLPFDATPDRARPVPGHIVSWSEGKGIIKGRTNTRYSFSATDLPPRDRHQQLLGLPVLFEPQLQRSRPVARKVAIEWRTVLLQSLTWSWSGPVIAPDALTIDGTCVSWHTADVKGVVSVAAGSLRTALPVSSLALDDVDVRLCTLPNSHWRSYVFSALRSALAFRSRWISCGISGRRARLIFNHLPCVYSGAACSNAMPPRSLRPPAPPSMPSSRPRTPPRATCLASPARDLAPCGPYRPPSSASLGNRAS
jgi:hypothetical protein